VNARDITDRIKLQQKLDLELASKQKDITAAIIETQEKERSQLGLELHDNVNQVLTTIKLYNEMLLDGLGDQKDILTRSIKHLQNCINEIRSISKRLSAPTLGAITLDSSIRELIQSISLTGLALNTL
jgi:signal transduction histidine kinase